MDANYFSLTKFLEGKKSASLLSLFLEEADAQQGKDDSGLGWGLRGAAGGSLIGILAGAALTATGIGAPVGITMVIAGAAAGLGGGAIAELNGEEADKEERALVDKILGASIKVECSSEKASVRIDSFSNPMLLEVDKKKGAVDPIRLVNEKGQRISSVNISDKQRRDFQALYDCHTDEDAQAIMKDYRSRRSTAMALVSGPNTDSRPALMLPAASNTGTDN